MTTKITMKKLKLKIDGMHCTTCVMLIEGDLEDCNGVNCATCNYAKGECVVEAEDTIDQSTIKKIITDDGYSVVNMEVL